MTKLRFALALLIIAGGIAAATLPSHAADCKDTAQALAQVRKALVADTPSDDRTALLCVAQALAALDAKVTASINGIKSAPLVVPFVPTARAK